jgi:hypothetical protein
MCPARHQDVHRLVFPSGQAQLGDGGKRGEHRTWTAVAERHLQAIFSAQRGVVQHDGASDALPSTSCQLRPDLGRGQAALEEIGRPYDAVEFPTGAQSATGRVGEHPTSVPPRQWCTAPAPQLWTVRRVSTGSVDEPRLHHRDLVRVRSPRPQNPHKIHG